MLIAATIGRPQRCSTLTDQVVLEHDEVERIAGQLEELYSKTKESAYDITSTDAAEDAMMLRERAGIEPNPELIEND